MDTYTPRPIDTSDVELPEEIAKELLEKLAEHNHDIWALTKINHGFSYGSELCTVTGSKTHPDLLPYDQLEEHTKDYDRNTAIAVLKAIIKLGYTIKKED